MFTDEQKRELSAPLGKSHVKERAQAGRKLSYIEGWHAIAEANRIFGFDSWDRSTLEIRCVAEHQRKIGRDGKDGWGVSYIARVQIVVGGKVYREGVGAGHGIDADLGLAHESAIKEAETDAMKRALMTFGNPFGLALYDKEQTNVADDFEDTIPASVKTFEGIMTKALRASQSIEDLNECWAQNTPQMKALELTKTHPVYVRLMAVASEMKSKLTNHERDAA
jgi:DNA recombination protein Rad52